MDRREALKKMMAGGAVVAGASMVSTSKVFAAGSVGAGQPTGLELTKPPTTTQIVNDKRTATWTIPVPDVSCSGEIKISSYAVPTPLLGNLQVRILSPSGYGGPYIEGPNANTATFTAMGTGPGNSPFRQGDAFEVKWHVKYECMVNNQRVGCKLVTYTYHYVNLANGNPNWQPASGYPVASPPVDCSN